MQLSNVWPTVCALAATTHPPCLPPPPATLAEFVRRRDIDAAIERYWGQPEWSTTALDDVALAEASGVDGGTYGECTLGGARSIFHGLELGEGDVFADLGSGVGKLAAQCSLECPVARVVAVELSEARHDRAVKNWRTLVVGEATRDDIQFVNDDLMTVNLDDVTHAYVANLCFDDATNLRLGTRLASLPSLKAVATLKKLHGWTPTRTIKASMSWCPQGSTVYVYTRPR